MLEAVCQPWWRRLLLSLLLLLAGSRGELGQASLASVSTAGEGTQQQQQQQLLQQHRQHTRPQTGFYAANTNRSIVVDSRWFSDPPGGVEALIQLSIAMVAATSPESVYVSGYRGLRYHERWVKAYGDKLIHRVKTLDQLVAGDIFIINEAIECPPVAEGVLVYAYLLANYRGCKTVHFISHNHKLLHFENLVLPRERLIQPYMSPSIVNAAFIRGLQHDGVILYSKMVHRSKKSNLVLVDDDVPESIKRIIQKVTESLGGKIKVLTGMTPDQMIEAYETAKIATDWCMRGSERCMYEASLFGAAVITNKCETGSDFLDLPIPSRYIFNHTDDSNKQSDTMNEALYDEKHPATVRLRQDLAVAIEHVFTNYWDLLDEFEPLRKSVISRTPSSMVRESVRFLASVGVPDLMQKKCEGC